MKQLILSMTPAVIILCGCASWSHSQLQVNVRRPVGMENRPVRIYLNDALVFDTKELTVVASLLSMKQKIRVEMEGARPENRAIKVASGKDQVVDFNLQRQ